MGASVRASLLMRGFAKESGAAREAARRLEPYYREMVQRAHAGDVGLRRRLD
jgi:5-methylthioadenosine/S-adenosylhomocysteine deaminase